MRLANRQGYNLRDQLYFSKFQTKTYSGFKKNSCASWNLNGDLFSTGDNQLMVWQFDNKYGLQLIASHKLRYTQIIEIKFFTNSEFVTISKDSFKIWDARDIGRSAKSCKKNKQDIVGFTWNHNTNIPYFALLAKDSIVSIYDIRKMNNLYQPLYRVKSQNDIQEISYDYSGSVLFFVGSQSNSDGSLMIYSNSLQPISDVINPHNARINSIAVDPTNKYLATCADDSLSAIYTLPDIICEQTYSHSDCSIRKASFSYKGEYLAVSCNESKLQQMSNKGQQAKMNIEEPCIDFYNTQTGGHAHRIKCGDFQQVLQWHPKKNILAYFDINEEENRKFGLAKEERYLNIYSV